MGKINDKAKDALDNFSGILENLGNQVELSAPSPSGNGNMTLAELFYENIRDFLLYLSCADGFITNEEAEFLDDYLEYCMTPQQMKSRIVREEIFSTEFEETEQMILVILVDMQNQFNELGSEIDLFSPFREIYKMIGVSFLECDGEMSNEETTALVKYIDMINQYASVHLDAFNEIEEERLSKKRRTTGGVEAPVKS